MNQLLAIAIPTYNRPDILIENLELLLPELRDTNVPIYISDDSTNDLTKNKIAQFQSLYPLIYYFRNTPSLGHDLNCLHTLGLPDSQYIWYLGDGIQIRPGGLRKILDVLSQNKCDFLVVNDLNRPTIALETGLYKDPSSILKLLAWHMTLSGATVYNSGHIKSKRESYIKYINSNFMQLGIILSNLLSLENGLYWLNERWIETNKKKKSYWEGSVFKVFAKDWTRLIASLPNTIPSRVKRRAIREHSLKTHLLELDSLYQFRLKGILGIKQFFKYWFYFHRASNVPLWQIGLIACAPECLLKKWIPRWQVVK
jgi:glycosyltransferase involved in cell wall biosynthesis